jgi:hypothetical protein
LESWEISQIRGEIFSEFILVVGDAEEKHGGGRRNACGVRCMRCIFF